MHFRFNKSNSNAMFEANDMMNEINKLKKQQNNHKKRIQMSIIVSSWIIITIHLFCFVFVENVKQNICRSAIWVETNKKKQLAYSHSKFTRSNYKMPDYETIPSHHRSNTSTTMVNCWFYDALDEFEVHSDFSSHNMTTQT